MNALDVLEAVSGMGVLIQNAGNRGIQPRDRWHHGDPDHRLVGFFIFQQLACDAVPALIEGHKKSIFAAGFSRSILVTSAARPHRQQFRPRLAGDLMKKSSMLDALTYAWQPAGEPRVRRRCAPPVQQRQLIGDFAGQQTLAEHQAPWSICRRIARRPQHPRSRRLHPADQHRQPLPPAQKPCFIAPYYGAGWPGKPEKGSSASLHCRSDHDRHGRSARTIRIGLKPGATEPNSPYSASKAVRPWSRLSPYTYSLPVLTTNCSTITALFAEKASVMVIHNALAGNFCRCRSTAPASRPRLALRQRTIAAASAACSEAGHPGETYNIGGWNEKAIRCRGVPCRPSSTNSATGRRCVPTRLEISIGRIAPARPPFSSSTRSKSNANSGWCRPKPSPAGHP